MVGGFDKYYQVAPCFRDEDCRSDRSLEFYQLDFEMGFAEEEDVYAIGEDIFYDTYTKFSNKNKGFAGFMRNISLNSLANRIPLSSRNDRNYYSAEISQLPPIDADEKDCQIFLTKVDGDVEHNNFISSLKKIK